MADIDPNEFNAETIEELFEPTVEVPAALLLATGCCGCCGGLAPGRQAVLAQCR